MKRMFVFMFALFCLVTSVPVFADNSMTRSVFPDLQDHWAQGTVDTISRIKVFVGYPDGKFYPDKTLTRAEFLAVLGRAVDRGLNLKYPTTPISTAMFKDVKPEDWFWNDVKKALERGWLNAQDMGRDLVPNDPIPRKEMARIIARVISQMSVELLKHDPVPFSDVEQANSYFADIDAATKLGVLNGYPDATFRPDGTLTRAEASAVILRTLQLEVPMSPYASEKFQGAWEASKMASMLIFGGWEETFSQKGSEVNLHDLQMIASEKAVSQYKTYLELAKSEPTIDPNSNNVWFGDFYPTYINNNLVLASWSLSFNKKIGETWYRQQTDPFTIRIRRNENRKWIVEDFPVIPVKTDQTSRTMLAPQASTNFITFRYQDKSGVYFGHIWVGADKLVSQDEAIPAIKKLFSDESGKIKVLRVLGLPVDETPNALLIHQLEVDQTAKNPDVGIHQLVVSKTGSWFEFTEGTPDEIMKQLWGDFNYYGGQYVAISLDGIPWTDMSDDHFWSKLQSYETSQKVMDNGAQLSHELEQVLQKYKK